MKNRFYKNIRFIHNSYIIFGLILFLTFTGCKKQKELLSPGYKTEKARVEDKIQNSISNYSTFQAKTSVTYNDGKKDMTVGAQIKMFKNSKIQVSIQPLLGIELFKLEINKDSIIVIDKINKRYMAEPYSQYKALLPVDLDISILEALFLNNLFMPGDESFTINDFNKLNWKNSSHGELIGDLKKSSLFNLSFVLNNNSFLTTTTVSTRSGGHKVDWFYSQFQILEEVDFPRVQKIVYNNGKKDKSLEIKYQKIDINKNINDKFDIPRSYKRVSAAQIMNMLLKK